MLVRVDALAEIVSFSAGLLLESYLESPRLVGRYEFFQGGQQELGAVDESELLEREGDVPLCLVCDANYPALHLGDG